MSFVPRRAATVLVVGLLAAPALLPLLTAVLAWATPAGALGLSAQVVFALTPWLQTRLR